MSDLESEGIPDLEGHPPGLGDDYNQFEGMMPPGDEPVGVDQFGVTPEEQRTQEPLAERVLREEPELGARGDDYELAGRLIEPDQGVAGLDRERDLIAGVTDDDDGLSAEEAAMHITDLP